MTVCMVISLPKVLYAIYIGLARTVYIYAVHARMFGNFPGKNTVYTPYIYGSGPPYIYTYALITLHEVTGV